MSEELLGPHPAGWKYVDLGELQEPKGIQGGPFGNQLHAADYVASGIPLIMPKNIGENRLLETGHDFVTLEDARRLSIHRVEIGDIIIGRKGDLSRRALIRTPEKGWLCGTDCIRIRAQPRRVFPEYLSYYMGLEEVSAWLHRHDTGSTMPSLNTGNLGRLPVLVGPRNDQEAIAGVLRALDEKAIISNRIVTTADSLLKAHFAASLRSAEREMKLDKVIELKYGKALKEENRSPGRVPVFGGNGISGWHNTPLDGGPGIIIGRKGANAGSVSWSQGPFWAIDTSFYVKPVAPEISLEFLFFLLREAGLRNLVGDSAIPGLNREIALSCTIRLPEEGAIRAFTEIARPLLVHSAQVTEESRSLIELRDILR
jgi:type I restriction enzyme, S subunit